MKVADEIILKIMASVRKDPSEIMIPNFHCFKWEMDVFRLMKNGYVVEYEVKVSRSDFFADFKKNYGQYKKPPTYKHELIASGQCANRFFFVVPSGLVKLTEIPAHAGIVAYDKGELVTVKSAPLLHRNIFTDYRWLATSLSWREDRWRRKCRH